VPRAFVVLESSVAELSAGYWVLIPVLGTCCLSARM